MKELKIFSLYIYIYMAETVGTVSNNIEDVFRKLQIMLIIFLMTLQTILIVRVMRVNSL
jgi:hypothetical protein